MQQKENVNPSKPSGSTDQPATQEVCNNKETCLNTVVAYSITKLNFDRNIIYLFTYPITSWVHIYTRSAVVVKGFSMTLMREDLETLDSLNWLNDQVNEKIENAHQFVYNSACFNWFYRSTSTST